LSNAQPCDPVTFEISSEEVNGPLNLEETVLSAQTSEPEWLREGHSFMDIEELIGTPIKYLLIQSGTVDRYKVTVTAIGSMRGNLVEKELRRHLDLVLGLKDDLRAFYDGFSNPDEPLSRTLKPLRGLRLMRGTNLYESLICSILSQNTSARLWNRTARLLMRHYGRKVTFPDHTVYHLFPEPQTVARADAAELRRKTSMGYRAKPVIEVSKSIMSGELVLEEIVKRPYREAFEELLELPGVGPKVADCFLLYGAGRLESAPVDVWIHRIVSETYFRSRKVSRLEAARFLRERFGPWAGYAQLYLFDYARRSSAWVHVSEKTA